MMAESERAEARTLSGGPLGAEGPDDEGKIYIIIYVYHRVSSSLYVGMAQIFPCNLVLTNNSNLQDTCT